MSSQRSAKPTKPTKPPNQTTSARVSSASSTSSSPSVSSHLAMVESKQRILTSLTKLADRDTHQIAVEDLEKVMQTLTNDGVSMFLSCLYDAANDPKPAVKKESIRFLATLCAAHTAAAAAHLTKIIGHIVKRLKDADSQVRDACRDAIGSLSGLYLKGSNGGDGVVSLFVKPLFELMSENNKTAQAGASMCLSKMVECASELPLATFQKLCSRVCKFLNNPNFFAKSSLLQVVSSLSQVGAIAPQNLESLLQSIHESLSSSDWATRKAAADALIALSLNVNNITPEGAASTVNALEACRFDKIRPVRESMTEALQHWKKIAGKGDELLDEHKASSHDCEASESSDLSDRKDLQNIGERGNQKSGKNSSNGSSPTDSNTKGKGNNISDKAVGLLRKKLPALTDKVNPEFFQKLETRCSDDLPVEVVVPRRYANPSNSQSEENPESNTTERENICDKSDSNQREPSGIYGENNITRSSGQSDGLLNNKGNWLAIQKQLLQLERQQAHLMNMLQDFMGGSHDSMVTLESRVRGLERVVEDMARDLSLSTNRRGNNVIPGFEGSSNRPFSKYSNIPDYGRLHFGDRYTGRAPSWRSDPSDSWDFPSYSKNGQMGLRKKSEQNEGENRRAWEKGSGPGPVRFGEGPSARSVWQASKDEATLEAIRVAGEDNGVARNPRVVAMPEMTAEALGDDGAVPERDPVWNSWTNAMDAIHVGDVDSAFAEVLSAGDDLLLVKLMDKAGPVLDQLSNEVACEVVHAVSQLIMEQNLFDTCLYWLQQLADIVTENGPDAVGIPMELKREILLNLHEASSSVELPEDWEGSTPDHLLMQLASAWEIDLQHFRK